MAEHEEALVTLPGEIPAKLTKWKVKQGSRVGPGMVLGLYQPEGSSISLTVRSVSAGNVAEVLVTEGQIVQPRHPLLRLQRIVCSHPIVMKDMCAECGADLRQEQGNPGMRKEGVTASVAMVHSIPELMVSEEQALELGSEDEHRLLKSRKLTLLVDLDQTVIHTTNDNIPPNLKDVYHFQMHHGQSRTWYHTKMRPMAHEFLEKISKLFELHICTFGARVYAHTIAGFLDPEGKYFSHRILSRDECFNPQSKTANLRALFPRGDSMVCIIDDREDVWSFAPNLIHVKPYIFFEGTADINAPPGLEKKDGSPDAPKHRARVVRVPRKKDGKTDKLGSDSLQNQSSLGEKNQEGTSCEGEGRKSTTSLVEDDKETFQLQESEIKTQTDKNGEALEQGTEENKTVETEKMDIQDTECVQTTECRNGDESKDDVSCIDHQKSDKKDVMSEKNIGLRDGEEAMDEEKGEETCTGTNQSSEIAERQEPNAVSNTDNNNSGEVPTETVDAKDEVDKGVLSECKKVEGETDSSVPKTTVLDSISGEDDDYEELIEWEDLDDYLIYLEDVLKRIHTAYYDVYDQLSKDRKNMPDLKVIIPYVKKKVLKNANIVFSGVIPTNAQPEKSPIYRLAVALGANVQNDFMSKEDAEEGHATTHVVAARPGTTKIHLAQKHNHVHIVNVDWLWTCGDRWERVDERLFPLKGATLTSHRRNSPDLRTMKVRKSEKRKVAETDFEPAPVYDPVTGKRIGKKPKAAGEPQTTEEDFCLLDQEENMHYARDAVEKEGPILQKRERRFSDDINPMYSFSREDIDNMDKEIEEAVGSNSESEDSESDSDLRKRVLGSREQDSSSEDSLSGDYPRGWSLRKKLERSPPQEEEEDTEEGELKDEEFQGPVEPENRHRIFKFSDQSSNSTDSFNDSIGSLDEEMAAAVEKEFLS